MIINFNSARFHSFIRRKTAVLPVSLLVLTGAPAQAAIFDVNDVADAVDANPGDGECVSAAGFCSLRAAVQEANALPGPDEIRVPAGNYVLILDGSGENAAATGDLDITDTLRIRGESMGISEIQGIGLSPRDRVFNVREATAIFRDLTISGGRAGHGGGIANQRGNVTLRNVHLERNSAATLGGGVHNDGEGAVLRMLESRVNGNAADDHGGGIANSNSAFLRVIDTNILEVA